MKHRLIVLALLFCLLSPVATMGWNGTGHMTVAYIAYKKLNHTSGHDTRARVDALLKQHPDYATLSSGISSNNPNRGLIVFMRAAIWPDKIKQDGRFFDENDQESQPKPTLPGFPNMKMHKLWHYYDEPYNPDGSHAEPAKSPNALETINWFRQAIGSTNVSPGFQAYDLSWLIHLVGDVHQPLHCIARFTHLHSGMHFPDGDRGGNEFKIQSFLLPGTNVHVDNLHSFWDDLLGVRTDPQFISSVAMSIAAPSAADHPDDLTTRHWIDESNELARTLAYTLGPDEPGDPKPQISNAYFNQAQLVAPKRVALAGYRLAAILNERLP
jgi:S1/P1 Nuclease